MKRSSLVLSSCAASLLIGTALLVLRPRTGLPAAPLRAIPPDIHGLARVRVARVLASGAWREVVVERNEDRGIKRVIQRCGFHPLASLSELFVFALPVAETTEVVVQARGGLPKTKVLDCVATYSGGDLSSYRHELVAGFDTALSKDGATRAAFVGRDGLVAGGEKGVRRALQSLAGEAKNAESDPLLRELHGSWAEDSDIALFVRVPSDPASRTTLAERLPFLEQSWWRDTRAATLDVQLVADRVRLTARLWMRDPESAARAARRLEERRGRVLALPGLALLGLSTPARELSIDAAGRDVTLRGELTAKSVNRAIDLLPALARSP